MTEQETTGQPDARWSAGRWAALFPGQGTQHAGMGEHLRRRSSAARDCYAEASELLGRDVAELCRRGPDEALRPTEVAQVVLFVTGCAYARFLADAGHEPAAAAGHSVGELCALVSAGAMTFDEGLSLVRDRGELMALAADGAMASVIGLAGDALAAAVDRADAAATGEPLVVAIHNAPGDAVVSGHPAAVERLVASLEGERRVRVRRLRVGGAFHSPLMAPLASQWSERVAATPMRDARLPVVVNASGRATTDATHLRQALDDQLTAAVRWSDCLDALRRLGVVHGVECGDSRTMQRIGEACGLATIAHRDPTRLLDDLAGATTAAARP